MSLADAPRCQSSMHHCSRVETRGEVVAVCYHYSKLHICRRVGNVVSVYLALLGIAGFQTTMAISPDTSSRRLQHPISMITVGWLRNVLAESALNDFISKNRNTNHETAERHIVTFHVIVHFNLFDDRGLAVSTKYSPH